MNYFIEILAIFTVSNKVLVCFFLFTRKNNALPVYLLALIFLLPGLTAFSNLMVYEKMLVSGWFYFVHEFFIFWMGPLLYIYALLLLGVKVRFGTVYWMFLPCIAAIVSLFIYMPTPEAEKMKIIEGLFGPQPPLFFYNNLLVCVQFLFFMVLGVIKIKKLEKEALQVFSNIDSIKLAFLKQLFYLMLALGFIALPASLFIGNVFTDMILLPICSNVYCFYIFYQSYNNEVPFNKIEYSNYTEIIEPLNRYRNEKYQNSKLSLEEVDNIYLRILNCFEIEKIWLEPEVKLTNLADSLNITAHKLSEVINRKAKTNFNDFVNNYRLEAAKKQLSDGFDNYLKIESLCFDCGFNNKSTFYRIFKEKTGLTPVEYRKKAMEAKMVAI